MRKIEFNELKGNIYEVGNNLPKEIKEVLDKKEILADKTCYISPKEVKEIRDEIVKLPGLSNEEKERIIKKIDLTEVRDFLFVGASPSSPNFAKLNIQEELNSIKSVLSSLKYGSKLQVLEEPSIIRLMSHLSRIKSEILHFACHCDGNGLILEKSGKSEYLTAIDIGEIVEGQNRSIELVFLNACEGTIVANEIKNFVPYVISFDVKVRDTIAIIFSKYFYEQLYYNAPNGFDVEKSFNLTKKALKLNRAKESKYMNLFINEQLANQLT